MRSRAWGIMVALLPVSSGAGAADRDVDLERARKKSLTQGKVCPDPARPCGEDFAPNELSFTIAKKFTFDRGEDKSLPFYALIVRSGPLCGMSDDQRVEIQALFPTRKVFLHRYFCDDFADNVSYTNINKKSGFLAVYAGETEAAAKKLLASPAVAAKFPDANIRKMQVVVTYQLE